MKKKAIIGIYSMLVILSLLSGCTSQGVEEVYGIEIEKVGIAISYKTWNDGVVNWTNIIFEDGKYLFLDGYHPIETHRLIKISYVKSSDVLSGDYPKVIGIEYDGPFVPGVINTSECIDEITISSFDNWIWITEHSNGSGTTDSGMNYTISSTINYLGFKCPKCGFVSKYQSWDVEDMWLKKDRK